MSWSKYNLFNLVRQKKPEDLTNKTLFQQKWYAKRVTRAYHGDRVTEKRWQRLFSPFLQVARDDGVEEKRLHPAALMYAELERRLDILLFRCLFAPSVYAARQIVSHGKVTVNGKKVLINANFRCHSLAIECAMVM